MSPGRSKCSIRNQRAEVPADLRRVGRAALGAAALRRAAGRAADAGRAPPAGPLGAAAAPAPAPNLQPKSV